MKAFFWVFVMVFSLSQEKILAKLYGLPEFFDSNVHNTEGNTLSSLRVKLFTILEDCLQELGLIGAFFIFCYSSKVFIKTLHFRETKRNTKN